MKQGCVLAPVIFNLFVSAVAHADSGRGNGIPVRYRGDGYGLFNLARFISRTRCESVTVGSFNMLMMLFSSVILFRSSQRVFSGVHSAYTKAGLSMNLTKTELLTQHTVQQSETLRIYAGSAELSVTERFTYLSSIITSDCSLVEEVSRRVGLASFAFVRLTCRVFLNHKHSLATKRSVY